jgi:hypothetical protein
MTLAQVLAKSVTPNGERGGIWQSNTGASADAAGNIYLTVGNGTVTAPEGGQDYGNAFLKLSPLGTVLDWFIPYNYEALNQTDRDLGAAGVLLIPNTSLLTSGGKEGKLYLLDANHFGHLQPTSDSQVVQSFIATPFGLYGTPTYWDGPGGPYIYVWGTVDRGNAFRLQDGLLKTPPVSQTKSVSGECRAQCSPSRPTERRRGPAFCGPRCRSAMRIKPRSLVCCARSTSRTCRTSSGTQTRMPLATG